MKRNPLWFLFNVYGWVILVMSVVTAIILNVWWLILFGIMGYQFVLFVESNWGGSLGRSGRVRLARAEQENRELRAEQSRLVGTIREQEDKIKTIEGQAPPPEETKVKG